ncbi:ROK family transcriptional regulator [Streptomyces sp. enrichment culture]|uniref:ROK family transcriptional regulator n=1 Tax=Streptomyces sp. enrichment culture TaxID=1795815 RepID=UPI003F57980D
MAGRSGTVRDLRRANRAAVLHRLSLDGPLSRLELGPATGLSSGAVSNVVADLVAEGLVEEAGSVGSDGGRPRTLLRVAPHSGRLIGVDVGETRVRIDLFDLALAEVARTERSLERRRHDPAAVAGHVRAGIAEVLAASGTAPDRLLGVGVGVPGIVEHTPDRGAVVHGQPIGWDAVPLESLLRAGSPLPETVPYVIDNGARTLGQAEMRFGGGRGARTALVVLVGSGIGACLVTPEAQQGRAVECGHLTVRVRGRRCRCGARGCLEAYAGAGSLLDRWREEGGRVPEGADEETALAALLAGARPADGGPDDPVAPALLDETAEYLGAGLAGLINLFRPERILIGGWAGLRLAPHLLPAVRRHARSYALRHPARQVTIEPGRLGPEAVTVGAAILPLADFFARGGHRAGPDPATRRPPARRTGHQRAPR